MPHTENEGWVQTFTGGMFFPLAPRREDIDIRDIAHSLSMQCRFNGHCRVFYSVAEHSVRVSHAVPEKHALWGLLHDAAEAYLTDLPKPVKDQMPSFIELEDELLGFLLNYFGLSMPMPPEVKLADVQLLMTEARDLMAPPPESWGIDTQPLPEKIVPMSSTEAETAFLERFAELTNR